MLRPAANAQLMFDPDLPDLLGDGWLVLELADEDISLRRTDYTTFRTLLESRGPTPLQVATVDAANLWVREQDYFWDDAGLTQEEVQREIQRPTPWCSPTV